MVLGLWDFLLGKGGAKMVRARFFSQRFLAVAFRLRFPTWPLLIGAKP